MGNHFQRHHVNSVINERLAREQSRFARSRIVSRAPDQIKGRSDSARRVALTEIADVSADSETGLMIAVLDHRGCRAAVSGNQSCGGCAEREQKLGIALREMKRREDESTLVAEDVFEELFFR